MTDPHEQTSSERLVFFTDAAAAIAMTLLILPLLEVISGLSEDHPGLDELIREHRGEFGAFLLSFAVIYRLWWAHHRLFQHISLIRTPIVTLSALWTLAIVFLPISTALITAFPPSALSVALYGGSLVLASGAMTVLARYARSHPELSADRIPVPPETVLGNFTTFVAQVVATLVGAIFADTVNYWAFLLMWLAPLLEKALTQRGRAVISS